MEETYLLNMEGVKKKILHGGCGELPDFKDGSKVTFHFQTLKDNFERTVIDDSRVGGIPMEIIVGKMFKIEVWETLLTSMRIGEVAEFWCDAVHTGMYALVSKGMRKIAEGKDPLEGQKHRCGMGNMFDYHSTGYADLDELQRTPQPLIFIMELFKVEDPSSYKRDTWAMSNDEKLVAVPKLHTEGNQLVLARKFKEAAEKYQEAVICLRNVQAKEKPWEEDWLKLEKLITPLVLNYCQCQLELGEYYEVLEHTTDLLQKNNKNVKAYFKRAKAHSAVWNEKEARADFLRVAQLDPSLAAAVRKELKMLGERMRQKHVEDRKRYQGLFQQPSKGETAGRTTEEDLSEEKEKWPDFTRQRTEIEENNRENLWRSERRPEGMEADVMNGEMGRGNEKKELMEKEGKKMDEGDYFPQKEGEKIKIEIGNKEEEEQGQGKEDSYSGDDVTDCQTSGSKQLGVEPWQPKEETENAGVERDQKRERGLVTPREEQERDVIHGDYGKKPGQATESTRIHIGEGFVKGCCEGEVNSTRERENEEAMCGTREVTAGQQRVQNDVHFGTQNFREEDRQSYIEDSEGNYFQVQNNESKGKAREATEFNSAGEVRPEQKNCGCSWREGAPKEMKEQMEGRELQRNKKESDHYSKNETEAEQGHCEANTEDSAWAARDGGKEAGDDRDEAKTRFRAENSKEEKYNHSKGMGCGKEGIETGSGFVPPEDIDGDEIRQESFESETSFKVKNLEMEVKVENLETDQADLPINCKGPEKARREVEWNLGEEHLQKEGEVSGRGIENVIVSQDSKNGSDQIQM
uniref:AIP/AIPL N-terminal FKBP-type PPIase domain-containing protein n=1 Tax=Pogona vitticeps TaxID=103695 RepID=A0ABM5EVM1_9SAUR